MLEIQTEEECWAKANCRQKEVFPHKKREREREKREKEGVKTDKRINKQTRRNDQAAM
jgi:hypothetical protein